MTRLTPLEPPYPDDLDATLTAMMPPGVPPLKLFRTLARSPRILGKIRAANLLDRGPLDRRHRELLILRTCARCGSEYEWGAHVAFFAERVGIDADTVRATRLGRPGTEGLDDDARLLFRLTDALHEGSDVDDALWSDLRARFSDEELLEAVTVVGFYHTISFLTQTFRVQGEDGAPRFPEG